MDVQKFAKMSLGRKVRFAPGDDVIPTLQSREISGFARLRKELINCLYSFDTEICSLKYAVSEWYITMLERSDDIYRLFRVMCCAASVTGTMDLDYFTVCFEDVYPNDFPKSGLYRREAEALSERIARLISNPDKIADHTFLSAMNENFTHVSAFCLITNLLKRPDVPAESVRTHFEKHYPGYFKVALRDYDNCRRQSA